MHEHSISREWKKRLARDRSGPYPLSPFGNCARGKGNAKLCSLENTRHSQEAQRRACEPSHECALRSRIVTRPGILAIPFEQAGFVAETAFEKASVHHESNIARRGQGVADAGSVNKIEPPVTCELIQTKWNFKLSRLDLEVREVGKVHIRIAQLNGRLGVVLVLLERSQKIF